MYLAPIEQKCCWDLISCSTGGSHIGMGQEILTFEGQLIQLNMGSRKGVPVVARVVIGRRQVVPPNSVVRVICKSSDPMPDYFIGPVDGLKILVQRVVHEAGRNPVMCVINTTDSYRMLEKRKQTGREYLVEKYLELDNSSQITMRL